MKMLLTLGLALVLASPVQAWQVFDKCKAEGDFAVSIMRARQNNTFTLKVLHNMITHNMPENPTSRHRLRDIATIAYMVPVADTPGRAVKAGKDFKAETMLACTKKDNKDEA